MHRFAQGQVIIGAAAEGPVDARVTGDATGGVARGPRITEPPGGPLQVIVGLGDPDLQAEAWRDGLRVALDRGAARVVLAAAGRVDPHALVAAVAEALALGELESVAITADDLALVARLATAAREYL